MSAKDNAKMNVLLNPIHCKRCDSQGTKLIEFRSPSNRTYFLCSTCVALEDNRERRFSPSWKRSRRPISPTPGVGFLN